MTSMIFTTLSLCYLSEREEKEGGREGGRGGERGFRFEFGREGERGRMELSVW